MTRGLTTLFWSTLISVSVACEKEVELPEAIAGRGHIEIIERGADEGETGWWPSIVFGTDDTPHLAYCDAHRGDLRYAYRTENGWHLEVVEKEGAVGKYLALALDSRDRPGIAFYDQSKKYLRYAWRSETGWKTERIAWGREIGMASELHFDRSDRAHLFYYVPSGRLVHNQRRAEGDWQAETFAEVLGGFSARISVSPRSEGYWVSFVDWGFKDTALMLAEPRPDGGHRIETVTDRYGPGWRSVLAFEKDKPILVYSQSLKERIKIAKRVNNEWKSEVLLRRAANFAGTQTVDGDLVIAYEDIFWSNAGNGTVKYLRRGKDGWTKVIADDEGPAGEYIDVAVNSKGEILIAYYSETIRGLKVYDETSGRRPKGEASLNRPAKEEIEAQEQPRKTNSSEQPGEGPPAQGVGKKNASDKGRSSADTASPVTEAPSN